MKTTTRLAGVIALLLMVASPLLAQPTNTFVVASYNVENWLLMDRRSKPNMPKPNDEKEAVYRVLQYVQLDVLGLVEIGTTNDLMEIAEGLRKRGLDFPHHEWVEGSDDSRHVALLSRFPIVERLSRGDYSYLLEGRPMRVQRGVLDARVQVNESYSFHAIVAHLKSKRPTRTGDQAAMRLHEARLLRQHAAGLVQRDPNVNFIVMGDLNDTPDSEPIRVLVGNSWFLLFDLMPVDSKGGCDTHFWDAKKLLSRIDYLLVSPGMSNEFVAGTARIADTEDWEKASDHRAISARFYDRDIGQAALPPGATASTGPGLPPARTVMVLVAATTVVVLLYLAYRRPRLPAQ